MMQKPKRMDHFFRFTCRFALLSCLMAVPAAQVIYGAGSWSICTGPEGGHIYDLAIDPQNPSIVYAAAGLGGIYRSTNGGASWSSARNGIAFAFIWKLAIDPQNPATLYAATTGHGVLKSNDGGASWNSADSGLGDTHIQTLTIDPQNPAILYAGTIYDGVFKSVNNGTSWNAVNNGLSDLGILAFAINPQNSAILYAGTYGGGVFMSTDSGQSWNPTNSGLNVTRINALAIDPQSPATVYAATYDSANAGYPNYAIRIFKSTDSGAGWSDITNGLQADDLYNLTIDPQDPATIYASTGLDEAQKSTDGGASWNRINIGPGGPDGTYLVWTLAIDPQTPATIYAGTHRGVYKSMDSGAGWGEVNNKLTVAAIQALTIDQNNPTTIYAATNSGIFKSIDACASWNSVNSGFGNRIDIHALAMDPQNPLTIYAGATSSSDGGAYRSVDGGASWSWLNNGPASGVYALAIDPQAPATIYAGTRSSVPFYRSTDGGASWQDISYDGIGNPLHYQYIWSLAVNPQDPAKVYAAARYRIFAFSSGSGWFRVYNGTSDVRALAIDPQNPSTIYAGNWSGVLKSPNSGATWNPANIGLGYQHVMALAIDPQNSTHVYAATSNGGVFRSTDGGTSWEAMSSGLADTNIGAMAIAQTSPRRVYIGTAGGAVWAYDVPSIPSSSITVTTNPMDLSFTVDGMYYNSTHTFSWTVGSTHTISVPTPQGLGYLNMRYAFLNWSDGGAISHTITVPAGAATYTANFITQYELTTSVSPQNGGTISANPSSLDGYYASGESVELTAIPNGGYLFSNWSGDLTSSTNPASVTMSAPRSVAAVFLPGGAALSISLSSGAAASYRTAGTAGTTRVGYAAVDVNSGTVPYATAVFSFKQNGITVTEAGVPASPPTTQARVFIEYRAHVLALPGQSNSGFVDINTGIAVVNTGADEAIVTYTLRDTAGNTVAFGNGTIAAGAHFAKFISQLSDVAPNFSLPANFQDTIQFGTLEIEGSQPLSVLALRGTNNQRNDFLITTTPVADLGQSVSYSPAYFPQFADGGGYTTSLVLLNTSDRTETGNLQIMNNIGSRFAVHQVGGTSGSLFTYSIPAGGALHFQTDGSPGNVGVGWARLIPDPGSPTPIGSGVFSYNPGAMLISESGIPSAGFTGHAQVYVDLSGGHNTGLAIANVNGVPASIMLNAYQIDGITPAGTSQGVLVLAAYGNDAKFADQFIMGLPAGFTGVLDISSTTPFAALTIRSLLNERHDFMMTTFPIADGNVPAPSPIVFPQIADGAGYVTEFIFLSPVGASNATLNLYDEAGNPASF